MITKINKIKKLGLFDDYTPVAGFKDFKKYNLIYGWNGSGKTTLSKLFGSLETGSHADYIDLEYEVQNESSTKFQHTEPFDQKVRVFNQDYIENNLKIREGKAKSITLVLGDVSKEVLKETEEFELELTLKSSELAKENVQLENKEKTKGKTFTEIAKTIYVAIVGGATRNYRKDNAEADFTQLSAKSLLSDEDLESLSITVKQLQKPLIDPLKEIEFEFVVGEEKVKLDKAVDNVLRESKSLIEQQVESIVIERLRDNQEISDWVESGLKVHHDHSSKGCEFCGQKIPEVRMQKLAKHFNEADKILKTNLDNLIAKVIRIKEAIKLAETTPDVARFYEELSEEYTKAVLAFSIEVSDLLIELEKVRFALKDKKSKTTESTAFELFINTSKFTNNFVVVSTFIHSHNKKTADFETSKQEATQKIKDHYLSTIFDEVKNLEKEIADHKTKCGILTNGDPSIAEDMGILKLRQSITENRAKISSTHKACSDITDGLNTFLGRKELIFEPHKTKSLDENGNQVVIEDGYVIKRNDKIVTHLSEGEKTAIAFVYFTIHLNDPAFNKDKGIVVIDDPISSLDSNSIFQAFSFLKNSVKDIQQVFILTHNYDFLRLVINWIGHKSMESKSSFYMIKNKDVSNERIAFLDTLDKDLQLFKSEYNYLFNILIKFQNEESSYCRKSSEGEDRQVLSIQSQIGEGVEIARYFNLPKFIEVFQESKSAITEYQRPEFLRMKKMIDEGKVDGIVCWKLDRLARNMTEGGWIMDYLSSGKLKAVFTKEKIWLPNDNVILMAVHFSQGTQYSKDLSENVKRGQKTKAKNGTPHGIASLGFLNSKQGEKGERNWLVDGERLPKIKKLLELFLTGNYSAGKLYELAIKELKLTTPQRKRLGGKLICLSRIYRILADPIYAGFFFQNDVRYEFDKNLPRIITEEQHERIKQILRKKHIPKVQKHSMTFSGYIKSPEGDFIGQCLKFQMICDCKHKFAHKSKTHCPKCGLEIDKMSNPKSLINKYYYNVKKKKAKVDYVSITEAKVENNIISFIDENLNFSPALLEWSKKYIHELKDKEVSENLFLQEDKVRRKEEFNKKKTRLREMLRDNHITDDEYKSDLLKLENDYADLKTENKNINWLEKMNEIVNLTMEAKQTFLSDSMKDKREILSKLGSHLTWDDKELIIYNANSINVLVDGINRTKQKVPEFAPSNFPLNHKGFPMKKSDINATFSSLRNRRDSNPRGI